MFHILKGISRKLVSLAAAGVPLSLLLLSACGGAGGGSSGTGGGSFTPTAQYACGSSSCSGGTGGTTGGGTGGGTTGGTTTTTGQAAVAVIGQGGFNTSSFGTTAATLNGPYGNPAVDPATGKLLVSDLYNNRILEYSAVPTTNGVSATLVIGQSNFTSAASGVSASAVWQPINPVVSGSQVFFSDQANNRIGTYNPAPTISPGTLAFVTGQTSFTTNGLGCSATTLWAPYSVSVGGGKMVVADDMNDRVLLYNTVPTASGASANFALGQPSMTTCYPNAGGTTPTASTMSRPSGVWTDGTRIVVIDSFNNRVLIWNSWPTTSGQPADLVLGQTTFTGAAPGTSATALNDPEVGVTVSGSGQLLITDSGNNRVLIWNTFPTANDQPADAVLGQASFSTAAFGTSSTTLNYPTGVAVAGSHTLVTDSKNNRVLVF